MPKDSIKFRIFRRISWINTIVIQKQYSLDNIAAKIGKIL
jgi:hypothetical protein